MKQLTVRGFDDELAEAIRQLARRDGTSLNQAALKLLRRGAGLPDGQGDGRNIGSALDDLFGSWSQEEAEAFDASLEVFETVDEAAWAVRALLDSGAYSGFMSGSHLVREIVQNAEEILMSAVVVGELLYGFRQGPRPEQNLAELRSFSRQAVRVVRACRPGDRGPLLQDHGVAEGEGTTNPDQRRVDRSTCDGDRRGPGLRGQPLRAHRRGRLGERYVGLRAAGHTGGMTAWRT